MRAFLATRLPGVDDLVPIRGGEWSQAFAFRAGNRALVARFGRHAEDYEKDRVAVAFATPDLPIPEIVEIGVAFDGVYSISARLPGHGFDTCSEAEYRRVFPSLLRALDSLRAIDTSASSGFGPWRPDGKAPYRTWRAYLLDVAVDHPGARTYGWRDPLDNVPGAAARFAEGYRILADLVEACPEDRHVIHADLMGDNVLVRAGRVTAIVDWGNAMYGDFLYDLARLTFWTPWFPALAPLDLRRRAREHYAAIDLNLTNFEARLRCYQVHIGLDAQAYNAFTQRWEELERSGRRTLEVAEA